MDLSDTIQIPKPKLSRLIDDENTYGVTEIKDDQIDEENFSRMVFGDELNQESSGVVRLIERLVKIILAGDSYSDNKRSIQKQSGHIRHKLEFNTPLPVIILNKYENVDENNFILKELMIDSFNENDYYEKLKNGFEKSNSNPLKGLKEEEKKEFILEQHDKESFKKSVKNAKIRHIYKEKNEFIFIHNDAWASFMKKFERIKSKCQINKKSSKNIESINIPFNFYTSYLKNWDYQLKKLSSIDESTWDRLNMDSDKEINNMNTIIMRYVIENFLGGYKEYNLPEKVFENWFNTLEKLNLEDYRLEFKPPYDNEDIIQLIASEEIVEKFNMVEDYNSHNEEEIEKFWKQGKKYILNRKISTEKLRKCTNLIQKIISNESIKPNIHLFEFLAYSITEKVNIHSEERDSGIDFETDIADKLIKLKKIEKRVPNNDLVINKMINESSKFKLFCNIMNLNSEKRLNIINENPLEIRKLILNCFKKPEYFEKEIKQVDEFKIKTLIEFGNDIFNAADSREFLIDFQKIINLLISKDVHSLKHYENYNEKIYELEIKNNSFVEQILKNLDKKAIKSIINRNLSFSWNEWKNTWGNDHTKIEKIEENTKQNIVNVLIKLGEEIISEDRSFCSQLINIVGNLADKDDDPYLDIEFGNQANAWNWLNYITKIISENKSKKLSDIKWNEVLLSKKKKN